MDKFWAGITIPDFFFQNTFCGGDAGKTNNPHRGRMDVLDV
jgi:hypothetical protein